MRSCSQGLFFSLTVFLLLLLLLCLIAMVELQNQNIENRKTLNDFSALLTVVHFYEGK